MSPFRRPLPTSCVNPVSWRRAQAPWWLVYLGDCSSLGSRHRRRRSFTWAAVPANAAHHTRTSIKLRDPASHSRLDKRRVRQSSPMPRSCACLLFTACSGKLASKTCGFDLFTFMSQMIRSQLCLRLCLTRKEINPFLCHPKTVSTRQGCQSSKSSQFIAELWNTDSKGELSIRSFREKIRHRSIYFVQ